MKRPTKSANFGNQETVRFRMNPMANRAKNGKNWVTRRFTACKPIHNIVKTWFLALWYLTMKHFKRLISLNCPKGTDISRHLENYMLKFLDFKFYKVWWTSLTHWCCDKMANFPRRHFQMHFLEWKWLNFEYDLTEVCSWGPIYNNTAMVQIMAWCRIGNKPLSQPMMA